MSSRSGEEAGEGGLGACFLEVLWGVDGIFSLLEDIAEVVSVPRRVRTMREIKRIWGDACSCAPNRTVRHA